MSYLARAESHWNWRLSAHCRIGSLAALWAVLLLMAPLGWILAPIAVVRTALSFVQTFLNVRLGKREPIETQTRFDWAMVACIFVAAYFAAGVGQVTGDTSQWWLYVPLLAPFTALQARMVARSYAAADLEEFRPATLVRLDDYRRAEPGELRAA